MAEDGIMCYPSVSKQKPTSKRAFNSIIKLELILMSNLTQEYRPTLSRHCWLHNSLSLLFLYSFFPLFLHFFFFLILLPLLYLVINPPLISHCVYSFPHIIYIMKIQTLHKMRCVPLMTPITSTKANICEYSLNNKP